MPKIQCLCHLWLTLQLYADSHIALDAPVSSVLRARTWSVIGRQEQIILDMASSGGDGFGTSVASDGQVVVVGAPNARINGTKVPSGAVYIFRKADDLWTRESKLSLSNSVNKDYFGWTVAIDRGVVAVGAYLAFGDAESVGLVYIYAYNAALKEWKEEKVCLCVPLFRP